MNGLIENIIFSRYTKFDVNVIEDYNIKGTFDPNAACDIEYYGYRDTDFVVTRAVGVDAVGEYEMTEEEIQSFVDNNRHAILLLVQCAIDKRSL
jgi:hypothetical protein